MWFSRGWFIRPAVVSTSFAAAAAASAVSRRSFGRDVFERIGSLPGTARTCFTVVVAWIPIQKRNGYDTRRGKDYGRFRSSRCRLRSAPSTHIPAGLTPGLLPKALQGFPDLGTSPENDRHPRLFRPLVLEIRADTDTEDGGYGSWRRSSRCRYGHGRPLHRSTARRNDPASDGRRVRDVRSETPLGEALRPTGTAAGRSAASPASDAAVLSRDGVVGCGRRRRTAVGKRERRHRRAETKSVVGRRTVAASSSTTRTQDHQPFMADQQQWYYCRHRRITVSYHLLTYLSAIEEWLGARTLGVMPSGWTLSC